MREHHSPYLLVGVLVIMVELCITLGVTAVTSPGEHLLLTLDLRLWWNMREITTLIMD